MAQTHGYHDHRVAYLARLRRIEGQVRGLQRMVDEDTYCIDILTQVSAVNKALQSVAVGLVEDRVGRDRPPAAHLNAVRRTRTATIQDDDEETTPWLPRSRSTPIASPG